MNKKSSSAPLATLLDSPKKPERPDGCGTVATMDSLEAQKQDAGKRPTKRGGKRPKKKALGEILEQLNESFRSEGGEDIMKPDAMTAIGTIDSREFAFKAEDKKPSRRSQLRTQDPPLFIPEDK